MKLRYHRGRGDMVHVMYWREDVRNHGWWEWPPGHVDAALRVTQAIYHHTELAVTCIECAMFLLHENRRPWAARSLPWT